MRSGHVVGAVLLVGLVGLTGCSGEGSGGGSGGGDSSMASDSAGSSGTEPGPASVPGAAEDRASGSDGANRTTVTTRAVIKRGEIRLTNQDIGEVRAAITDLLADVGGTLDKEETSNDQQGRTEVSTLVLRVPVAEFDATKKALEGLGTLESTDENSKDVTTEVIDVDERVQTLQNSLDRLQKFQASSDDVADLLRYEDQITTRQGELQSLKAQQSYLRDQTSMSTITVHVTTPEKYVAPPDALEDAGFLAGLQGGWNALLDTIVVVLTIVGALLPFVVVGVLLGVPVLLLVRRLLRRRTASPAPAEG